MDFRKEQVKGVLTTFLSRFSPPQNIRDNVRAQQDEAAMLLKVLMRHAPSEMAGDWAERVLGVVAERARHRAWPLPVEVGSVAKEFSERRAEPRLEGPSFDPVDIAADRMNRGEPVADYWLWGVRACELIRTRKVAEQTMNRYRSALFFAEKDTVGEEKALQREAERKAKHDAARNRSGTADTASVESVVEKMRIGAE